jgi:hypothetical protein
MVRRVSLAAFFTAHSGARGSAEGMEKEGNLKGSGQKKRGAKCTALL